MDLQRAKGVRDFLPPEKIIRNQIVQKLQSIFEIYGFNPLETPAIERYDLFSSKYGSGEESDVMQESFTFGDRGNRKLVLRNELTVPFARVVGMNRQLKMPFKRYQIGRVFRDGPLKLGRYREFWQCDVDVVGCPSGKVDAELIEMAQIFFRELGLDIEIRFNSRILLNEILEKANVSQEQFTEAIIAIDKFDKLGREGVQKELEEKNILEESIKTILDLIDVSQESNTDKITSLKKELAESKGLVEIEEILSLIKNTEDIIFVPSLARGQAYYTGSIIEVFLKDTSSLGSSLAAGGRYDNMIGGFLEDGKDYPAIGLSFGLDTIMDALAMQGEEFKQSVASFYVMSVSGNEEEYAKEIIDMLRGASFKVDRDYLGKSYSKCLDYANTLGIPYVIICGEDEVKKGTVAIKDMKNGEQKEVSKNDLANYCKELVLL